MDSYLRAAVDEVARIGVLGHVCVCCLFLHSMLFYTCLCDSSGAAQALTRKPYLAFSTS
jgi:hypothetical protein